MPFFRKKPVVIEAVEVSDSIKNAGKNWQALPQWLRDEYEKGNVLFLPDSVEIVTLEGRMTGSSGDWIIQGVKGELYPCRGDIFDATYEKDTSK